MKHLLTSLALILAVSPAYAATYYVATNGSDTAAGTSASPFRTMSKASTVAQPGDVIRVKAGVYQDAAATKRFSASGTATNPITLTSDTKFGAKITVAAIWAEGAYVTVKDFEVDGATFTGSENVGIYITGNGGKATGNWVHDLSSCSTNGSAGILLDGYYGGSAGVVDGNRVDRVGNPCTGNLWHGIYSGMVDSIIQNNVVTGVPNGGGVHVWHDGRRVKIRNNTLTTSQTGIVTGCGDVYRQTCASGSGGMQITGNILNNNVNNFNESGTAAVANRYDRNLEYGQQTRVTSSNGQLTTAMLQNPILSSPGFVSATDFHLTAGSLAIGSALQADSPLTDFDGVVRPQAGSYDVGAFEYVMPTQPPPGGGVVSCTVTMTAPQITLGGASVALSGLISCQ